MKVFTLLSLLSFTSLISGAQIRPRNYEANDYYVLHLDSTVEPHTVAQRLGLTHEGQLGELEGHHIFSAAKHEDDIVKRAVHERRNIRKRGIDDWDTLDAVKWNQKQKLKPKMDKRAVLPPNPNAKLDERRITPFKSGKPGLDGENANKRQITPFKSGKPGLGGGDAKKRSITPFKSGKPGTGGRDATDEEAQDKRSIRTESDTIEVDPFVGFELSQRQWATGGQADAKGLARQAEVASRLDIGDPIFKDQWHLYNPVEMGHDVNVTDVWLSGVTGFNTTVAIVDDGLDMYSLDLKDNYFAEGSYDYNDHNPEPKPRLDDDNHGTRCAGEVAAGRNAYCGIGVAFDAKVAGIRILSALISDADEAEALNYGYQQNQIYSCSWGPLDNGKSMDAPDVLIKRAMLNAVQKGRQGKGSIYVFAAGNGADKGDNCNFDGYTNSIYSITVGAVDRKGKHPYYGERCCAQLVVTYSSGSGDAIHTTDVGVNNCVTSHGGTSAAAPLAAGIFALALNVRPELTWRDMQTIAWKTAVKVPIESSLEDDWQMTFNGKEFSHTFGYGKVDAWALVEEARTFKSLKPQAWYFSPWIQVGREIPQGTEGLAASFEVTKDMLKEANLEKVEHVTVTMNAEHQRRGDLSADLISPEGVISHLSVSRPLDDSTAGYRDWTFMSVAHWGEPGVGKWTVVVRDAIVNTHKGNFTDFRIKLWGESLDASKATLLPMPNDDDDINHDGKHPSTSAAITTTSVAPVKTALPSAVPTDVGGHRPVPPKLLPSEKPDATSSPTASGTAAPAESSAPATQAGWLSWLPTFGFGPKTTAWTYGALGLIIAFCGGLGVYFWWARRKAKKDSREGYEFEMLRDEEEGEGLNGGGGGKGKRRAGELYDAFATGSDEEGEMGVAFGSESESEESGDEVARMAYRDRSNEDVGAGGGGGGGGRESMERERHVLGGESDEESDDDMRRR